MDCMTDTTLRLKTQDGDLVSLTVADCVEILNAMARRHLLTVSVEDIPAQAERVFCEEFRAIELDHDCDCGESEQMLMLVTAKNAEVITKKKGGKK